MDLLDGLPFLTMPLAPEQLTRRLRWADGLSDSVTGVEARAAAQLIPFAELEGVTTPASLEESRRGEDIVRAALEAGQCAWVDWACPAVVNARAGSVLTLDSAADLTGITHVWAYHPRGLASVHVVSSLAGNALTLASATGLQTGDLIYPVRWGFVAARNVTGSAQGQGTRALALTLAERPRLGPIDGTFTFWREDTGASWLSNLANVYFLINIDDSGSMDDDVPAVLEAANALKVLLRDRVYGGDQDKADEFVRIDAGWTNERWLQRLAAKVTGEESSKYVNLTFINEAATGYHTIPRNAALEPRSEFSTDYAAFIIEQARRDFSRGKVYSINPSESQWLDDNAAFNAHLADAVTGAGNYAALGTPLADLGVAYAIGIPSGTDADWYLSDILNLLGVNS